MTPARRLAVLAAGTLSAAAVGGMAAPAQAAPEPPPAPPAPVAPAPAAPARAEVPCAPTARACVDLSAHKAWLTDGAGHVTYGPVAARGGSRSDPTPVGTFTVSWKDRDHLSRQFDNAPMPNSVFFAPGIAFHGGNPSENSNGCVHLGQKSSAAFFGALREGDLVQVVP
ncbi:L,D-transpeptidase [Pseudonocardia endophytica]|uniref:L,D-transpeptidase-like protein n=1 Tax=Pseudonocardia endophytica TaxID=401976 RepID=A0A4R1HWD5_PSEEN|nr:L,D-transpeptidase [Pseudonocardia endophytica]TCK26648.1 L,D-transpeptidase-like protein [Pseudonocardia endophytica]